MKRRTTVFAVLATLALTATLLAGASTVTGDSGTSDTAAAGSAKQLPVTSEAQLAAPMTGPPFGVTARGEWSEPAIRQLAVEAGVRWASTAISWASLEPTQGAINLSGYDSLFAEFQRLGIIPIVYITDNPSWAASSTCGPIDLVPQSTFGTFMRALAARYDGDADYDNNGSVDGPAQARVDYWSLYNEPDNEWVQYSEFGGCWGQAGAQYAQLLRVAWDAVHEANPNGQLGFGGLGAEPNPICDRPGCVGQRIFNSDMNDTDAVYDFVDDVLNYVVSHPGHTYYDFMDIHAYPAFANNWDAASPYNAAFSGKATYYKKRMTDRGLNRYLISTESGRPSAAFKVYFGVPGSDEEQSRYLVRMYAQAMAVGVRAVIWFSYSDFDSNLWGLLGPAPNYTAKPSYTAFKTLTQQLGAAAAVGKVTLPSIAAEIYAFDVPGLGARSVIWSSNTASAVNVPFLGSILSTTDKWGTLRVYRDGQAGDQDGAVNGRILVNITGSPIYADGQPDVALTSTPTHTHTGTPTRTHTVTETSTRTPAGTSTATSTSTSTSTATATHKSTATATPTTSTNTPTPTLSSMLTPTATDTRAPTRTVTPTNVLTLTPTPTATSTAAKTPGLMTITGVRFSPALLMSGDTLMVEIGVRNDTGVTALSQGPLPGFTFNEGETVDSRAYPDIAGRWRVGVDFAGRSVTVKDHPYRWGLGADLAPGQSATVTGYIRLTTARTTNYWVGLVQEAARWQQEGVGTTSIAVTAALGPTSTPPNTNTPTRTSTPTATPTPGASSHLTIADVRFSPFTLVAGDALLVEVDVRNDGAGIAVSQGPASGFVYGEGDTFASRGYAETAGRWRVGVDFDGRSTAVKDHPYRWGLGEDLAPGASTTISGTILLTTQRVASYWAGLVEEGARWWQDEVGTTSITVGAPKSTNNLIMAGGSVTLAAQVYQCTPDGLRVNVWKAYSSSIATYLYTMARPADKPCGALNSTFDAYQLTTYAGTITPGSWVTQCAGAGGRRNVWRANADGRNLPYQYPETAAACP